MVPSESEMVAYNQNLTASRKKEKDILCATLRVPVQTFLQPLLVSSLKVKWKRQPP